MSTDLMVLGTPGKLRTAPNPDADVLGFIEENEPVIVLCVNKGGDIMRKRYTKVLSRLGVGWVFSSFLVDP